MSFKIADRVKDTTTTTGTGTVTLSGTAPSGFQSFNSGIGDGNSTCYCIKDANGTGWEVGIGTYTNSGTTLSRTTILASSNAGSAITLSSGTHTVFCTDPANKSTLFDQLFGSTQNYALVRGASTWAAAAPAGGSVGGFWSANMQAPVPTQSGTGLSSWFNQPAGATVTNDTPGLVIFAPSQGSANKIAAVTKASAGSGTAQKYTILITRTAARTLFAGPIFGWSDGTKAHVCGLNGNASGLVTASWTNSTTYGSTLVQDTGFPTYTPFWLQLQDDATNIKFNVSFDGKNFVTFNSTARSSAFLGSTGYTNIIFGTNAYDGDTYATMHSWLQGT